MMTGGESLKISETLLRKEDLFLTRRALASVERARLQQKREENKFGSVWQIDNILVSS